jgi:hypothetical protein
MTLSDEKTGVYFTVQLLTGPSRAGPLPFITLSPETPITCWDRLPYLCPAGTAWPIYAPEHWVPFLSPLMTRRDYTDDILTTKSNWTISTVVLFITYRHGPHRKRRPQYFFSCYITLLLLGQFGADYSCNCAYGSCLASAVVCRVIT